MKPTLENSHRFLFPPAVHIMGAKVAIACSTGFIERVEDASYTQVWDEHVGTDYTSIPYVLGNGRIVRDEIYTHHYVERSQRVGRNKVTIRTDGSDSKAEGHGAKLTFYFGKNVEFGHDDRVVVVGAGFDSLVLVNETRRYQIFTGESYRGDPLPDGPLQALGRMFEGPVATIGMLLLLCVGAWMSSSVLPWMLCWSVPVIFLAVRVVAARAWNGRCDAFRRKVRDACETALRRLELVRAGATAEKAHSETFGDASGAIGTTAHKPWTVAFCEGLGATALPPVRSRQWYEDWIALEMEKRAKRGLPPSPEVVHRRKMALEAASREFGRAYVKHKGFVPPELVAEIGYREIVAERAPRPDRHLRIRGNGHHEDQWQIHWGRPKWRKRGPVCLIEHLHRQSKWFDEAVRNGTIPPLPEQPPEPGQRFQFRPHRSFGIDPAYPDAKRVRVEDQRPRAA